MMGRVDKARYDATPEARARAARRYDRIVRLYGERGRRALEIAEQPRLDDGYFGPGSISWRVYDNILVGGMGALSGLIIAVFDPIGGYGVGQHSYYQSDTLTRVRRSLRFFSGAVFGDTETAQKIGRDLFRTHSHINGTIPGSDEEFRANHVEALKFTYVMGWPHLWRAYKLYGDPNATAEDERAFYAEQHMVGELLGIPVGELPLTPEAVAAWVADAEENIVANTRPAQDLVDYLFRPKWTPVWPMALLKPGLAVGMWSAVPLLTPYVREISGLAIRPVRTKLSQLVVSQVSRVVQIPLFQAAFLVPFAPETWGYQQNAIRHAPGTGRVPMVGDPGLALQRGKGGTLPADDALERELATLAGAEKAPR